MGRMPEEVSVMSPTSADNSKRKRVYAYFNYRAIYAQAIVEECAMG